MYSSGEVAAFIPTECVHTMIVSRIKEGEEIWRRRFSGRSASEACRRVKSKLDKGGWFVESGYAWRRSVGGAYFWIIVGTGDNCLRFIEEASDPDVLARTRRAVA